MSEKEYLRQEIILLKQKILELEAEIKSLKKNQMWYYSSSAIIKNADYTVGPQCLGIIEG